MGPKERTSGGGADAVGRARRAYGESAWADAYEAFGEADARRSLEAADLDRFAWSAALVGHEDVLLRLLERLYQAHMDARAHLRAARAAFWLGMRLASQGEQGRAAGWIARSARLVEAEPEASVEQGYLHLPGALGGVARGDFDGALAEAREADAIGERFGEKDLVALARQLQGRVLTQRGSLEEGTARLDDALVAAASGELSPYVTGLVYCSAITGCNEAYIAERAREWTTALAEWVGAQPQLVAFTGHCLVQRADVLIATGAWSEALPVIDRVFARHERRADPEAAAGAWYQRGEVLRLQGDTAGAEEAYRSAAQLGREPQPGLALLRLAQRKPDAAVAAMRRVLGITPDRLRRAKLLPAAVEVLIAGGDLAGARAAADELRATAAAHPTAVLAAMAATAHGIVLLAEGEASDAMPALRDAFEAWRRLGAPYEEAKLRVHLARVCVALGDEDAGAIELATARAAFDRLGAVPDVAAVDALAGRRHVAPHGLTPREVEVLRLIATGRTNKEIARLLFVSEKTVDRHVSNLFAKVHVSTRSAATAWAYEHDLVNG